MSGIAIALLFLIAFFGTQVAIESSERKRREQAALHEMRQHEEFKARQRKLAPEFAKGLQDMIRRHGSGKGPGNSSGKGRADACGNARQEGRNSVICNSTMATTHRVMEDDPAWDCSTMGNKLCGPTVKAKGKK